MRIISCLNIACRLCAVCLCILLISLSAPVVSAADRAGLEFGHPNPGQRRLRLMTEWYRGFNLRGQFYNNKVTYYGMGVSLGF